MAIPYRQAVRASIRRISECVSGTREGPIARGIDRVTGATGTTGEVCTFVCFLLSLEQAYQRCRCLRCSPNPPPWFGIRLPAT
jgi:hypothetical protein